MNLDYMLPNMPPYDLGNVLPGQAIEKRDVLMHPSSDIPYLDNVHFSKNGCMVSFAALSRPMLKHVRVVLGRGSPAEMIRVDARLMTITARMSRLMVWRRWRPVNPLANNAAYERGFPVKPDSSPVAVQRVWPPDAILRLLTSGKNGFKISSWLTVLGSTVSGTRCHVRSSVKVNKHVIYSMGAYVNG